MMSREGLLGCSQAVRGESCVMSAGEARSVEENTRGRRAARLPRARSGRLGEMQQVRLELRHGCHDLIHVRRPRGGRRQGGRRRGWSECGVHPAGDEVAAFVVQAVEEMAMAEPEAEETNK